mmetsp:Transcript_23130/g.57893  ORF Transcript_23130/g.57893 Transcript_23130/m.57893 type:complete len:244 (+) Transcript_23130:1219-1950(+)
MCCWMAVPKHLWIPRPKQLWIPRPKHLWNPSCLAVPLQWMSSPPVILMAQTRPARRGWRKATRLPRCAPPPWRPRLCCNSVPCLPSKWTQVPPARGRPSRQHPLMPARAAQTRTCQAVMRLQCARVTPTPRKPTSPPRRRSSAPRPTLWRRARRQPRRPPAGRPNSCRHRRRTCRRPPRRPPCRPTAQQRHRRAPPTRTVGASSPSRPRCQPRCCPQAGRRRVRQARTRRTSACRSVPCPRSG